MCGIYGTTLPYNKEQVTQKLQRTSFRGPDQLGTAEYLDSKQTITFGHNRLSIIDLDMRSNQPFTYANKVHLVYNGEIYNFKKIRNQLIKQGHNFNTTSDTEVVCAAYLEYGQNCVSHFNGMFAFVIYDSERQLLFGSRDRMGQKPFYYHLSVDGFEFASQISSIQLHNKNLTVSSEAIKSYLNWNAIPQPLSIFNEIHKLEDAHSFEYNLDTKSFKKWPYWDISSPTVTRYTGNFETAKKDLEVLLTDAVKQRMVADVPLGVFLSGGVDSSLVAALASRDTETKVQTFSVKFNEKGFDESVFADKVATHLKTEHNVIECDYKEGIDLIQNFSTYYDEPFADASAIPSMLLAKHTKKQVTVALSGDGADESFLGYHRYHKLEKVARMMRIPFGLRTLGLKAMALTNGNRYHAVKNIIGAENDGLAYLEFVSKINAPWLIHDDENVDIKELKYLIHQKKDIYERAGDFDLKTYLSWVINTKVDRATMAYSLEARSPFLDYRVVEFAQSLPTDYKYQSDNQKRILKELLYDYVPKEYFNRPKSGFGMPLEIWFRNDLKDMILTELSPTQLKNIPGIQPAVVTKMIAEHMSGSWNHYPVIWKLLVLKQWLNANSTGITVK